MEIFSDEYFMRQALKEAQKAGESEEVPIGTVIVIQNKIIARGYNQVETLNDATAHAEIIALTSAFNYLGSKYIPDATLYVTIEPCPMCCGALFWSKTGRLVYGATDLKHGGLSLFTPTEKRSHPLHPKTTIVAGVLADECARLMTGFFKSKR
jgi:tRNA(adenine34) deaminase